MTSGKIHAIYAGVIIAVIVLAVIVAGSWTAHVRDDAKRDAVIETQRTVQDTQVKNIQDLEKQIATDRQAATSQIADLQRQRVATVAAPAQVPDAFYGLLKQILPQAATIKQDQALTKEMAPDAPSATLTKQNQIDLFTAASSCKECFIEKSQLAGEVEKQKQEISEKDGEISSVKTQRDEALKDARGGSVWQRTWRVVKWGAVFGATGYVLGRAQK